MKYSLQEGRIGNVTLRNRWIMLAMHMGFAEADGAFGERDFAFYKERAAGQLGAITLVAAPNECGAQEGMHRLDGDQYNAGLKQVCDIIHEGGTKVILQLFHAGRNRRQTEGPWEYPIAPSDVQSPIYRTPVKVMTEEDIRATIADFASAALRCKEQGVDIVEVSVSVGYLLTQFLSPRTNLRNDDWGGDEKKRMRFPTEVLKAIRQAVGDDYPVIIKISGGDMLGGYDVQYMVDFINQLPQGTIQGVTVTGGWHEAPVPQMTYHVAPSQFSYLAREIREKTGLPTIACNRNHDVDTCERILAEGHTDFIGVARPLLTDPLMLKKMIEGKSYYPCQACNKGCIERVLKGKDVTCAYNPLVGWESLVVQTDTPKKILVAGSGPVGLWTAGYAARSGHAVTVVTASAAAGGRLTAASKPPHKAKLARFCEALTDELADRGVEIRYETPISRAIIEEIKPDLVFFATGAEPILPQIEGLDQLPHYTADQVLLNEGLELGRNVIVVGGGSVGLETAESIAARGRAETVVVIDLLEKVGKDLGGLKWIMMGELKKLGVQIFTSTKLTGVSASGVTVENMDGVQELRADTLIFAVGAKPNGAAGLEGYLEEQGIDCRIIGDADGKGSVMSGLIQGFTLVNELSR